MRTTMDTLGTEEWIKRKLGDATQVADAVLGWRCVVEEAAKFVVEDAQAEGYELDRAKAFSVLVKLLDRALWHAARSNDSERADALAVALGMHADCDNRGGACPACRQGGAR